MRKLRITLAIVVALLALLAAAVLFIDFAVDRVVLEHRLLPLLRGDIVVDRLVIEAPIIEVINDEPVAVQAANVTPRTDSSPRAHFVSLRQDTPGSTPARRSIAVLWASVVDATLLLSTAGEEPTTRVYDLDVELTDIFVDPASPSIAVGLSGEGYVEVGEAHFVDRTARGNRAALNISNGLFTVSGLALEAAEGRLAMSELVVDLNPDPYVYRVSISGERIDLNNLLGVEGASGLGMASLELDAVGEGPETATVVGSGSVHLAAGRIPDAPALDEVADLIGLQLAGLPYDATTIEFSLADDRVTVSPFTVLSESLRLEAGGALSVDGAVDARALVSVPREGIVLGRWQSDFSEGMVDALTDDDGWVSIPVLIGGTVDEPRVGPDTEALLAALQASAGRSLGNWLKGIIKR